jgi:catechol 2,3-dioxygenase-like lactoylglutathione lyase family enzyme
MDMRLEVVQVPVSDVDRAKAFYEQLGFNPDHDHQVSDEVRFVQLTPPGSACSIVIGTGLGAPMTPGAIQGLMMVIDDADAARAELNSRGIETSDVQEMPWGRFVFFNDPDGNGWSLQQIVPQA